MCRKPLTCAHVCFQQWHESCSACAHWSQCYTAIASSRDIYLCSAYSVRSSSCLHPYTHHDGEPCHRYDSVNELNSACVRQGSRRVQLSHSAAGSIAIYYHIVSSPGRRDAVRPATPLCDVVCPASASVRCIPHHCSDLYARHRAGYCSSRRRRQHHILHQFVLLGLHHLLCHVSRTYMFFLACSASMEQRSQRCERWSH